jgi:methylglutamate dehydrogenase subunit D
MVERESPLGVAYRPGSHGNFATGAGVRLIETRPGSIVQVASWPGREKEAMAAIASAAKLTLADGAGAGAVANGRSAFGFAPGRFLVIDQAEGMGVTLAAAMTMQTGTVTDLSHGRTAIRISGPKAEWVLAKFFALDFSLPSFPLYAGRSTAHHDVFTQIQRTGELQFDLYVFRSLARSFWLALCHGAEEVGYEVV